MALIRGLVAAVGLMALFLGCVGGYLQLVNQPVAIAIVTFGVLSVVMSAAGRSEQAWMHHGGSLRQGQTVLHWGHYYQVIRVDGSLVTWRKL